MSHASSAGVKRHSSGSWPYRADVVSRIVAAVFGGYALATTSSVFVSRLFGLPRAEAVMTGLLMSFPIYAAVIMWCFATRSAGRAWSGIASSVAATAILSWAIGAGDLG